MDGLKNRRQTQVPKSLRRALQLLVAVLEGAPDGADNVVVGLLLDADLVVDDFDKR